MTHRGGARAGGGSAASASASAGDSAASTTTTATTTTTTVFLVGTISGNAEIDILPPLPPPPPPVVDDCGDGDVVVVNGDSSAPTDVVSGRMGWGSSATTTTTTTTTTTAAISMSLDVIGRRTSRPHEKIVVRRPVWMKSVPISVVVVVSSAFDVEGGGVERLPNAAAPSTSSDKVRNYDKDHDAAVLRIRIRSLDYDGGNLNDDDDGSPSRDDADALDRYGPALPRETYELRTIPPRALRPGNYAAAGTGAIAIPESWRGTMDDIIGNDDDCNTDNDEKNEGGGTMVAGEDLVANGEDVGGDADGLQPTTTARTPHPADDNRDGIILICGAKGVGKSTFLRYAANRFLSAPATRSGGGRANADPEGRRGGSILHYRSRRRRRVAILDLDCGQPELGPPGTMSLTIVSQPLLLDPPGHMVCGGSIGRSRPPSMLDDDDSGRGGDVDAAKTGNRHHEASYFFGDVTSKADPDAYVHMASRLLTRYRELRSSSPGWEHDLPLLVNSDGWVKGLGYEILSAVVGVVDPGHVVQIVGNTKAKSFDMSAHSEDGGRDNTVDPANDDRGRRRCRRSPRRIHVVRSFDGSSLVDDCDDRPGSSTGPLLASASDHRAHRLCAYFLGGYDAMANLRPRIDGEDEVVSFHRERGLQDPNNIIGLTLASMTPYAVPFRSVRVYPPPGFIDGTTDPCAVWGVRGDLASDDALESLNGSVVGLCRDPEAHDGAHSHPGCDADMGVPVLDCVGLGIIRSVDRSRGIFFVLTPVHPPLLAGVTTFVGGNIQLPLECVYRGVHSDSFPYMSCGHAIASAHSGSDAMKSRSSLRGKK